MLTDSWVCEFTKMYTLQSQAPTAMGALFATDLAAHGMDFEEGLAWRFGCFRQQIIHLYEIWGFFLVFWNKNAPKHRAVSTFWDVMWQWKCGDLRMSDRKLANKRIFILVHALFRKFMKLSHDATMLQWQEDWNQVVSPSCYSIRWKKLFWRSRCLNEGRPQSIES